MLKFKPNKQTHTKWPSHDSNCVHIDQQIQMDQLDSSSFPSPTKPEAQTHAIHDCDSGMGEEVSVIVL